MYGIGIINAMKNLDYQVHYENCVDYEVFVFII